MISAQEGKIRGSVIDNETGEPLVGVTVLVGATTGTITDLDGKFSLNLEPGMYNLQISYISYQTLTIEDIEVLSNDVSVLDNIRLTVSKQKLEEVVITAEAVRSTETALVTLKKKAPSIMDGISASKIQLTGDGTAVEAAKRITGVSVEGGKYVYVRGLGDRYTKTTLNGVTIPGLDPDRNTIQMDIFPTSLISNILVSKNFTAEMPADFTGGLLNIETKDFPSKKILSVSAGTSYNPNFHFNKDFISYKGAWTDNLGFDNGTRRIPDGAEQASIPYANSPFYTESEVADFVQSFNPTLNATNKTSLLDFSAGISIGNQIDLKNDKINDNRKMGYILSLSYKSNYKLWDDVMFNEFQKNSSPDVYDLKYATIIDGDIGEQNHLIGFLGGLAYKTSLSKLKFTAMHLQNSESRAAIFNIDNNPNAESQSGYTAISHNLEYNQRSITNLLFNGTRLSEDKSWKIEWKVSPTYSYSSEPDIRKTAFTADTINGTYSFDAGAGGNPSRIWRSLNELNATAMVDISKTYELNGKDGQLKFGAGHTYKLRNYEILAVDIQFSGTQPKWSGPDPSLVTSENNLYPTGIVYYQSGNANPNPNQYTSDVQNASLYISNELELFSNLKTILGVRAEQYIQRHTGRDATNAIRLDREKVLESIDLFPSANLIYALTENQNLRFTYSRTIARPSFKELSFAQILDPINNRIFNGALFPYLRENWDGALIETRINNLDLRWELFQSRAQMFSISGFYKHFENPIELVRIYTQRTSNEYQPRNVGDGTLYGVELEFRKNLGFVSYALDDFLLSGNVTFVESIIEMSSNELDSRLDYEKTGQIISEKRQMAGQSPYVLNGGLTYTNYEMGMNAGIFYNVKGPTLYIVGGDLFPDIFSTPFHSLNFSVSKKIGQNFNSSIDFKISNLLNDEQEMLYQAYKATPEIFEYKLQGRTFSIGYKYSF
ncbi:MAG TPA: TonB-dependent receptor [Bacteroidales bacterium]|nr:TonB-dependent receptor [Bacteroidales bacterium]